MIKSSRREFLVGAAATAAAVALPMPAGDELIWSDATFECIYRGVPIFTAYDLAYDGVIIREVVDIWTSPSTT